MSEVTHAKVKFEQDKSIKIVPIDKIVEFCKAKPVDVNDFDRKVLYRCLWSDEKNLEEVELAVQISDLAVIQNEEDLQSLENKRGHFTKINETIVQEFYDELDNDDDNTRKGTGKKSSVDEKNALVEKKRVQKEILNEKMEKFLNSKSLLNLPSNVESAFPENSTDGVLDNIEKEKLEYNYSTLQERFNELLETHNNLKKKYSSLEKENINLRFLNQSLQIKLLDPSGKCNYVQDEPTVVSESQSKKKKQLDLEISAIPPIQTEYEQNDDLHTSSPILSQGQCQSIKENSKTDFNDIPKTNLNDSIDEELDQAYEYHCSTPTRKRLYSSSNSDTETSSRHTAKKLHFDGHESQEHNSENIQKDIQINKKEKESSSNSDTETSSRHTAKKLHFDGHESQEHNSENIQKDIQINKKEKELHKTKEKTIENCNKKSKIQKEVKKGKENKEDNSLGEDDENRIKTSTKKHEKEKRGKSKDNDENDKDEKIEFLSKFEVEEDGEKINKYYLGEGIYINQDTWNDIVNVPTSNRFIVAMLKEFYTPQQLSKRSLSGSEAWKTPNGVHTRQKLTPKKCRIIKKCTKYYLKKKFKLTPKQLDKQMSFNNKHITGYISKVVNSMKSTKPKKKKIIKESDEDEESGAKESDANAGSDASTES